MRAIFYNKDHFLESEELILDEESTHHLHVTRAKTGEEVLILNGLGQKALSLIQNISKKQVIVKIQKVETAKRQHNLSLVLGLPKKEAFEDIIKISVELGIVNIFPTTTQYSQYTYEPNDRIQRIIQSAMVQSNNSFLPKIFPQKTLSEFLVTNDKDIFFLNSVPQNLQSSRMSSLKIDQSCFYLIGPEAGFSQLEIDLLRNHEFVREIHLPTPILRAPTAVAAAAGFILNHISSNQ